MKLSQNSDSVFSPSSLWRIFLGLCAAITLMFSSPTSLTPSAAQAEDKLQLNAPCDALDTLDVTTVENPSCEATSAAYFDKDGNLIYVERLKVDRKRHVTGRLVRVIKACPTDNENCEGGCGRPGCTLCIRGRCGCIC